MNYVSLPKGMMYKHKRQVNTCPLFFNFYIDFLPQTFPNYVIN